MKKNVINEIEVFEINKDCLISYEELGPTKIKLVTIDNFYKNESIKNITNLDDHKIKNTKLDITNNEDIKKLGKKNFTFKILLECKNKRSLRYYECYYQMLHKVLTTTLEGTDEPAYYNNYVGGKFYRPVQELDV